ncbi:MFS transporter [Rhodospirillum rubrum]|uniref:MFS transporter n=1 Tax=Rhodospirillum rubrum TaxID=1085 RepID=UPI00190779BB|nr:MFS transporter [Rhodospirillum rubrum]MBK1664399.1 MFS transporter [Rhodospirillum rubrum]MBK1677641.1 MFS transporter [Rhodospirillum rubrum]
MRLPFLSRFFAGIDPRGPEAFLLLSAAAQPVAFSTWQALLNNFAIERASFSGADMGLLQSLREVPGLLALTVIFFLFILREQTLLIVSLVLLGVGTAITGLFPSILGLFITTIVMSIGFHYQETLQQSLTLQWIDRERAAPAMGRQIAARGAAGLIAFAGVWLMLDVYGLDYAWVYAFGGALTVILALAAWMAYPRFPDAALQTKKLFLRKRYWLFYALTFMSGARRQIFTVFAGFMMVEKFGYSAAQVTLLFIVNQAINMVFAGRIGAAIGRWGERRALSLEYAGLIGIFVAYAVVENPYAAAGFYIIDNLLFSMAIAIRSYFQKIAAPADIAASSGVSFTINHIAAVGIPGAFGLLWLTNPAAVFLTGAAMAAISLTLARLVPEHPEPGHETLFARRQKAVAH